MGGYAGYAPVVTDELVFYLDAGNDRSYPGSGSTFTDLIKNHSGSLINTPTYSSSDGGIITFNGSNEYTSHTSSSYLVPGTGDFSTSCFIKYNGPAPTTSSVIEPVFSKGEYGSGGEYWLCFRGGTYNGVFFRIRTSSAITDVYPTSDQSSLISDGNYHLFTFVLERGATLEGKLYIDDTLVASTSTISVSNITSSLDLNLAKYYIYYGAVSISSYMFHRKALTQDEVIQNYNALKNRFV